MNRGRSLGPLFVAVLCAAVCAPASASNALYAVASRGTSAVAVGDSGRILYAWPAPHNRSWFGADQHFFDEPWTGVAVGSANYWAVGLGGRIVRSSDQENYGTTWIIQTSRTTRDLYAICQTYAEDRLVAVGDSGTVLLKPSLGTWGVIDSSSVPTRRILRGVASSQTHAVAVGIGGTIIWSQTGNLTAWFSATTVPTELDLHAAALGPGNPSPRFWAVGEQGTILIATPNGAEWRSVDSGVTVDLNGVTFSSMLTEGRIGVAVGSAGTILRSNGGEVWQEITSPTLRDLHGVAFTGNGPGDWGFVAVGDENTILWSANGLVWQEAVVPVSVKTIGSIRGSWRTQKPR